MAETPGKLSPQAVHLVRTATQTNLMLSQMADQKASILMGATFVVFTIAIGQSRGGPVPLSLLVLAGFAFLSAMCAVAAILPSIASKSSGGSQPNLLFFGTFTHLSESEFADRVIAELGDDERIYRTMLRDIHQNGMVLQHKKYRYLRIAYTVFLAGLVTTFVVFLFEARVWWGAVRL
ncbi:MAG: Pycsar system effector family protein [Novosphingobium sp.]